LGTRGNKLFAARAQEIFRADANFPGAIAATRAFGVFSMNVC
jgi:hypothetical protein